MENNSIPAGDVLEALRAGYNTSANEASGTGRRLLSSTKNPAIKKNPEAFLEGVSLRKEAAFVYSADTMKEYEEDTASYDALANRLNQKYGKVAVLSNEATTLGIIPE